MVNTGFLVKLFQKKPNDNIIFFMKKSKNNNIILGFGHWVFEFGFSWCKGKVTSFLFFIPEIESLQPVVSYPFEHVVCLDNLTKDHPKNLLHQLNLPRTLSQKALRSKALLSGRTTKSVGFKAIMDHLDALSPTMSLVTITRHQWAILVICKKMIFG